MTGATGRPEKTGGPAAATLYAAFVALVLGYGLSYFTSRLGGGMLGESAAGTPHGPAALARAGLNLCASMHAALAGSGEIARPLDGVEQVSALIVFPLTVWAGIPAFALFVGGYSAARFRAGAGRWGTVVPAVAGGVLFAVVLAFAAPLFGAAVPGSALPAVNEIEFNPPDVVFSPVPLSTLASGAVFGVVFAYLGALAGARGGPGRNRSPGRWWAAGSSVVAFALAVQFLIAAAIGGWFLTSSRVEQMDPGSVRRFLQMLPSASGTVYALVHGATLDAFVESTAPGLETAYRPWSYSVNLYRGVSVSSDEETAAKSLAPYSYVLAAMAALAALLAGWTAARRGSRDGAVPTAARAAIVHTLFLALIIWMCSIGWSQTVASDGAAATTIVSIGARLGTFLAFSFAAVFVMSFIGAFVASLRRSPTSQIEIQ